MRAWRSRPPPRADPAGPRGSTAGSGLASPRRQTRQCRRRRSDQRWTAGQRLAVGSPGQGRPRRRCSAAAWVGSDRRSHAGSAAGASGCAARPARHHRDAPSRPVTGGPSGALSMLDAVASDISRLLHERVMIEMWDRFRKGERDVFTMRLYTAAGQQSFETIRRLHASDRDFRDTVKRYIQEFERLMPRRGARDATELGWAASSRRTAARSTPCWPTPRGGSAEPLSRGCNSRCAASAAGSSRAGTPAAVSP